MHCHANAFDSDRYVILHTQITVLSSFLKILGYILYIIDLVYGFFFQQKEIQVKDLSAGSKKMWKGKSILQYASSLF